MDFNNLNSIYYVVISTVASIIVTILIGYLLLNLTTKEKENNSIFSINPEYGLFELPIFWMGITLPLCLFVFTGIPIWSKYQLNLSADAYKNFMEISKFPAILLATAIPISAAISRAHSTHQTAMQIRELIKNRERDQIYRYKNEIEKKCDEIVKSSSDNEEVSLSLSLGFFKNTHVTSNYTKLPSADIENISFYITKTKELKETLLEIDKKLSNFEHEQDIESLVLSFSKATENLNSFIGDLIISANVPIYINSKKTRHVKISLVGTSSYMTIINIICYIFTHVLEESVVVSNIETEEKQRLLVEIGDLYIDNIRDFGADSLNELLKIYKQNDRI